MQTLRKNPKKRPLIGWSTARHYEWLNDRANHQDQLNIDRSTRKYRTPDRRVVSKYMPHQGGGEYVPTRVTDKWHGTERVFTKAVIEFERKVRANDSGND
ncbi:hypothetical protein [uncultured Paraglaciecola sp.]|uniref:hypothetical protein n=1 Tax=uncultured Paraglaciecola sp. TaxID=1765024 RepID=UPI0026070ACF|nr:hypothetical protein [uncultured Paraglaciecola sp.]